METFSVRQVRVSALSLQFTIDTTFDFKAHLVPNGVGNLLAAFNLILAAILMQAKELLGIPINFSPSEAYLIDETDDEDKARIDVTFYSNDAIILIIHFRCDENDIETMDNIEELRAAYEANLKKKVGLDSIIYTAIVTPTQTFIFKVTFNKDGSYTIAKSLASPHSLAFFTPVAKEQFRDSTKSFIGEVLCVFEEQTNRIASKQVTRKRKRKNKK
jgi:hypothetical protein